MWERWLARGAVPRRPASPAVRPAGWLGRGPALGASATPGGCGSLSCGRPPGPGCHQAERCRPAAPQSRPARATRALPPNGCPGAGAPPRVLGGARPPAKVTRVPAPGNARAWNATAMDSGSLGLQVGKLRPEGSGDSPRSAATTRC